MVEAKIVKGKYKKEYVFPHMPMIPTDLSRIQFPVRLDFAMATNKLQGQS